MREEETVAGYIARVCMQPVTSEKARLLARDAIIDTLACMVAGRNDQSTQTVMKAFAVSGGAGEALLVDGTAASPLIGALVNGTAAHALDYDDNFLPV